MTRQMDAPRTALSDAEAAEAAAQPFTDAELQRLRHEPFAPLWSSLAGLVARFLATIDADRAAAPQPRDDLLDAAIGVLTTAGWIVHEDKGECYESDRRRRLLNE